MTSGDRELRLPLPCQGDVVRVNPMVQVNPRLVGFSPYERGWIALVRLAGADRSGLLSGQDAIRWFRGEVERLETATGKTGDELIDERARAEVAGAVATLYDGVDR
jgi:hypothetical protein